MNVEFVQKQLEVHDKRLDNHSERLDALEKSDAVTNVKLDNLCEKLDKQTKSINALIGTLLASLLGFFFYAVQQGIFH
jgi:chromosome segregation ATPase